jgi:hypothetical protein
MNWYNTVKLSAYDSYGYWITNEGKIIDANNGHADALQNLNLLAPKTTTRRRDSAYNKVFDMNWIRVVTSQSQFTVTSRKYCTKNQAEAVAMIMMENKAQILYFELLGSNLAENGGDVVEINANDIDKLEKIITGKIKPNGNIIPAITNTNPNVTQTENVNPSLKPTVTLPNPTNINRNQARLRARQKINPLLKN